MRGWFSDVLDEETKSEKNNVEVSENYLKKKFRKTILYYYEVKKYLHIDDVNSWLQC